MSYLLQGDLNQDGHLNVLDNVLIVNIIIGTNPNPTPYELVAADLNNDGNVDVLDVIKLAQLITNYNLQRDVYSGNPIDISLLNNSNKLSRGSSQEIELVLDTDDVIAGLQMDIEFDDNLWIFDTITLTTFTENMIIRYNEIEDGIVRFIIYSEEFEVFGPGEGTVAILHFAKTDLNRGDNQIIDLNCINGTIGSRNGTALQYTVDNQENALVLPTEYKLSQNYPNPFNANTTIMYDIPVDINNGVENQHVSLIIYNTLGQQIIELVNKNQTPGSYQVTWNGKNDEGNYIGTGIYLYEIKANIFSNVKKMTLVK